MRYPSPVVPFLFVPRSLRFPLAIFLARVAGFFGDALFARRLRFGNVSEYVLAGALTAMNRANLRYDPDFDLAEFAAVHGAAARGEGFLIATTHANGGLAALLVRALDDAGIRCVPVASASEFTIYGRARMTRTILPASALLAVRREWRQGVGVCAMIDTIEDTGVAVAGRGFSITEPLLRLAVRCKVPVLFVAARIERRRIALHVGAPSDDDVAPQFARFVAEHLHQYPVVTLHSPSTTA